ncbi:hypothetical protein [Bifidobacterium thermophilum]|uniref:hypothetical protein n=1 Tax=Bifidobacterium thermophilum TaxID=33905 RepID=UPI0030A62609
MPAVRRARQWTVSVRGRVEGHDDFASGYAVDAGRRPEDVCAVVLRRRRDSGLAGDGRDGARDLVERLAIRSLLAEHLTGQTPAQAYIIAWRRAWDAAIGFCIDAEQALDQEDA